MNKILTLDLVINTILIFYQNRSRTECYSKILTENFQTIEKKEEKLILKQKSGLIINQKNEKRYNNHHCSRCS